MKSSVFSFSRIFFSFFFFVLCLVGVLFFLEFNKPKLLKSLWKKNKKKTIIRFCCYFIVSRFAPIFSTNRNPCGIFRKFGRRPDCSKSKYRLRTPPISLRSAKAMEERKIRKNTPTKLTQTRSLYGNCHHELTRTKTTRWHWANRFCSGPQVRV